MLVRKLRYLALLVLFVSSFDAAIAAALVSAAEARSIAKEVYIFGAAYVDNYRVYIKAPVDTNHLLPGVRFNEFLHLRQLVGPEAGDYVIVGPSHFVLYTVIQA